MATTPTMSFGSVDGWVRILNTTSSATDRTEVWKSEAGGAAYKICNSLDTVLSGGNYLSTYNDYNIKSGVSYSYFLRAVDVSAGTASCAPQQTSISLLTAWIHSINKSLGTSNASYVTHLDDQSHSRQFAFESALRLLTNTAKPSLMLSSIETGAIDMSTMILTDSNRSILRSIYQSRSMCGLRDALGNLWYGRVLNYKEAPDYIRFDFPFSFEILDFTEALA